MKKQINVSSTAIDDALWRMSELCRTLEQDGAYFANWAFQAVSRYIGTARASTEWLRKFINLEKSEMEHMIGRAVTGTDRSDDGMMRSMNKFLGF